jgi:hypothetical protein
MGRRNKEKIRQEMFREGEEVLSPATGFLLGFFLFLMRLFEAWTSPGSLLYMAVVGVEILTIIAVVVGILYRLKYGGWIVVKYLLSFVGSYEMFRILVLGRL